MIDPTELAAKISGTLEPTEGAVRSARLALAACWDECVDGVPGYHPESNPYRRASDGAPGWPKDWNDVDVTPQQEDTADGGPDIDGVWIVWRSHGDRSNGFNAIYPGDEEIQALRQVNADGFGAAEFIEFGPTQG